jgi:hypothetical protein
MQLLIADSYAFKVQAQIFAGRITTILPEFLILREAT